MTCSKSGRAPAKNAVLYVLGLHVIIRAFWLSFLADKALDKFVNLGARVTVTRMITRIPIPLIEHWAACSIAVFVCWLTASKQSIPLK